MSLVRAALLPLWRDRGLNIQNEGLSQNNNVSNAAARNRNERNDVHYILIHSLIFPLCFSQAQNLGLWMCSRAFARELGTSGTCVKMYSGNTPVFSCREPCFQKTLPAFVGPIGVILLRNMLRCTLQKVHTRSSIVDVKCLENTAGIIPHPDAYSSLPCPAHNRAAVSSMNTAS